MYNLKYLGITILVAFIAFLALVIIFNPKQAGATQSHREWGNWSSWSAWSTCTPEKHKRVEKETCGTTVEGTQTREKTRTCINKNGNGSNECSFVGQVDKDTEHKECSYTYPACEVEPTPTPEVTPQPVVYGLPGDGLSDGANQPFKCGIGDVTQRVINPHLYRKGDQAIVKWFPTAGNKVHIYYKQKGNSDWQYSVTTDNTGYFVINGLGTKDITFGIQQVDSCSGGVTTDVYQIVDGNTHGWVLFR